MRQTEKVVYQSMSMGAICKLLDPPTKEMNYMFSNGRTFYEQIRSRTAVAPVLPEDQSLFSDRFMFVEPVNVIKD